jgi:hypothetical protein
VDGSRLAVEFGEDAGQSLVPGWVIGHGAC